MVFTSLTFIAFSVVFFPLYFMTRGRIRIVVCIVGSYFFYGWWDWRFLSLILISTVIDYSVGRMLLVTEDQRRRRALLAVSIAANLSMLGFFKYFNFFADSLVDLFSLLGFQADYVTLKIILPVGISFYTFQTMSYTIDVYRRKLEVEESFLNFAAYVAFFPQLVAGPIVRASRLLPQLRIDHPFDWTDFLRGMEMVLLGFFMKLVVADNLAIFVDERFAAPDAFGATELATAVLFFSFQIYGDFAGYSLIAIGLGRIMGFDFGINFRQPYFAASFSEFWQRWHISLSSWLRDYLYIGLGGNRHGAAKTFRNLVLTMALGGLWHGANWTFIVWGLLHGAYLVVQRVLGGPWERLMATLAVPGAVDQLIRVLTVFILTMVAWVFFRAQSLGDALVILERIFSGSDNSSLIDPTQYKRPLQGFGVIAMLLIIDLGITNRWFSENFRRFTWLRTFGVQALLWSILMLGSFTGQQFIYFQF